MPNSNDWKEAISIADNLYRRAKGEVSIHDTIAFPFNGTKLIDHLKGYEKNGSAEKWSLVLRTIENYKVKIQAVADDTINAELFNQSKAVLLNALNNLTR